MILPVDICDKLGIKPGVRLEFRVNKGKLEAFKVPARFLKSGKRSLKDLYGPARNKEELVIQRGCSCEVPADFPK